MPIPMEDHRGHHRTQEETEVKSPKKKKYTRPRGGASCPCPKCGKSSRVVRTSLGARLRTGPRDHVLRERRCIGTAHHRFHTEERPR